MLFLLWYICMTINAKDIAMGIRIINCPLSFLLIENSPRELLCLLNNSMGASLSAKVNPHSIILSACVLPFIILAN
jgi:hypothetical protein